MASSSTSFGSFAPYTPPPDDPAAAGPAPSTTKSKGRQRPWFPSQSGEGSYQSSSYQSGGLPIFDTSNAGGAAVEEDEAALQNLWETRFGMRVDILAAVAYLGGPLTALILLIFEHVNDYVRFHAYQSALLTTPLLVIRLLMSLIGFPAWLSTLVTLLTAAAVCFMAYRAYIDAARNGLVRYHLPRIGGLADRWVGEE